MPSPPSVNRAIESIAAKFESHFREKLRPVRKVGKEAEFPVVTRAGRAADVEILLQAFMKETEFTRSFVDPDSELLIIGIERGDLHLAIEAGRGTLEMALQPCDDLWELQKKYTDAISLVARVAESCEMYLLGFGIQPRTNPSVDVMTRRRHYDALFDAIGAPWLRLTTTAADQTHVDISRAELLDAINSMNLLSAPLIALCANSSVYAGRPGKFVSGRERLLKDLGETRYGMTPRQYGSIEDFIRYLCAYKCFVLSEKHGYKKFQLPFADYLASEPPDVFEEFLWHEHYVWNSARARIQTSTVEVRPACQQPWDEPFAANALILGWVESLPHLAAYFRDAFGDDAWDVMRVYRRAAVRDGLKAREPIPNFVRDLVRIAEEGLKKRGRSEEKFIAPMWERLERRESPGMRARKIFEEKGMEKLIEELKIGQD